MLIPALLAAACSNPTGGHPDDTPAANAQPAAHSAPAAPLPPPPPRPSRADRLAADGRARTAAALSLFDAGAPRVRVESDLFVLVDVNAGRAFEPSVTLTHDFLAVLLDGRLTDLPYRAVTVWLFGMATRFDAFRKGRADDAPETPYGLYHSKTREIFVNTASAGIFTLTHELMHVLIESDLPLAPVWLAEGLASLYELPDLTSEPGQIHGKVDQRRKDLLDALSSPRKKTVTLDALFAMSDAAFRDPETEWVHYAQAREAMRWLDTKRKKLWPFYTAWRGGILDDPTGEKAFRSVVGETPAEANGEWLAWVTSREGSL